MKNFRFVLEKYRGPSTRYTCPQCRKSKSFVRYVDRETSQHLPFRYGRCNRENNCGYHLNPYKDGYSQKHWKDPIINSPIMDKKPMALPSQLFRASLKEYGGNSFFQLLVRHFGREKAADLIRQYYIGSSSYWPGACVFWIIDQRGSVLGGQVASFDEEGHTKKWIAKNGDVRRCTGWVHAALKRKFYDQKKPVPYWLKEYIEKAEKFPVPFGLHLIQDAPLGFPVAIVEAPKTAVIAAGYFPQFIWMAIGSLSYLTRKRVEALRGRPITLFPDQGAFQQWERQAENLKDLANIRVSRLLEEKGSPGSDLADYLVIQHLDDSSSIQDEFPLIIKGDSKGALPRALPEGLQYVSLESPNGSIQVLEGPDGYPLAWD